MKQNRTIFSGFFIIVVSAFIMMLSGCGSGGDGSSIFSGDSENEAATLSTESLDFHLPSYVEKVTGITGTFDGTVLRTGTEALPDKTEGNGDSDVSGFLVELPAFQGESSANAVAESCDLALQSGSIALPVKNLSIISRQSLNSNTTTLSVYRLETSSVSVPSEVNVGILEMIGLNQANGSIGNRGSGFSDEPSSSLYTVYVSIVYFSYDCISISVAVVPEDLANAYEHVLTGITSYTNIGTRNSKLTSYTQQFQAETHNNLADFLFVVDNSGSMSEEQTAVSLAATEFINAMKNSGLDPHIAVITTDSPAIRDTNSDGGFTDSLSEFENDVVVGTNGSGTESGIWFGEQALSTGGSVISAGYPRTGSTLSVIMMSDEPDQYSSYASGATFSQSNNIFINQGYPVFSIVDTSNSGSDYTSLSNATGGSYASIHDLSSFPSIMAQIAKIAGGASSSYILDYLPLTGTIAITVGGLAVNNSVANGWTYNVGSNAIVFHGNAIPGDAEIVKVSYSSLSFSATSSGSQSSSDQSSITEKSLAGDWIVQISDTMYDTSTYSISVSLNSDNTFTYTEYNNGAYYSNGDGTWSFDSSTNYFGAYADEDMCSGSLSAGSNSNAFSVSGSFYDDASVTYNWTRN